MILCSVLFCVVVNLNQSRVVECVVCVDRMTVCVCALLTICVVLFCCCGLFIFLFHVMSQCCFCFPSKECVPDMILLDRLVPQGTKRVLNGIITISLSLSVTCSLIQ